jgi:hypothetical protein
MKYLKSEIENPTQEHSISKNDHDLEGNASLVNDNDEIFFDETRILKAVNDFNKSKYMYEEAVNPDEFFLPYVWTNIVSYLLLSVFTYSFLSVDTNNSRVVVETTEYSPFLEFLLLVFSKAVYLSI